MKIDYNGYWTKIVDENGREIDTGLFFKKTGNKYLLGFDDFYCNERTLKELKVLSEFLVDYIKKEESL